MISKRMVTFSLLIIEDPWLLLDFPATAVFAAHLSEGIQALRSLRKERKTPKSSLISKGKVNRVSNFVELLKQQK